MIANISIVIIAVMLFSFGRGPNESSVYVVVKDKLLADKTVITHCHENLVNYECPKEVYFIDELPKSNVGKILQRKIKEAHIEEIGA